MARTRTFIAVEASGEIRRRAIELSAQLGKITTDVRWVSAANLHWTMQFLGDVEDLEIPAVCNAVAATVAEIEPFDLAAFGAGAFPSADRPRTLWIGAGQGGDEMAALHETIERRLRKLGYRSENRRFVPHITLGRAGGHGQQESLSDVLGRFAGYDAGTMLVDEVVVFSSELTRDGAVYDVLSRAPLAQ